MEKKTYETPKVTIIEFGAQNAMCNNVVCTSINIEKSYTGFNRYNHDDAINEDGVIDYGTDPFNGRQF